MLLITLLSLAGCTGRRVLGDGKALVTLARADLKELREAFRTAAEKSITLPTWGEISCAEKRCLLPVAGLAPVYENEALVGKEKVRGQLAIGSGLPAFLLEKCDGAAEADKDFLLAADSGQVSCNSRHCVLEFTFPKGASLVVDRAGDALSWRTE